MKENETLVGSARKALFFDIDGTLVSFRTHEIPPSAIAALTQAKASGARIYIATGRPHCIINNLAPIEHLIDGYITTNGAMCSVGETVIRTAAIPQHEVETLLQDARRRGYSSLVIGERRIAVQDNAGTVKSVFCNELGVHNLDFSLSVGELMESEQVMQVTAFFTAEHDEVLQRQMPGSVFARWHPAFTDINSREADKGKGLLAVAAHEGIELADTFAFGDGGNDVAILRQAGNGIAMGNAGDDVKAAADYVATSVDEDGILNALKHYNII